MASTPICRCRVLYLGSSVPHVTKDGLHGIQEPLRELYPEDGVSGAKGIDSWLSVWSNGLLLENVDEKRKRVTRFFPIDSLHYCAAVRHVTIPGVQPEAAINSEVGSSPAAVAHQRFLPLDSPFARIPSPNNPPLFACILRRTSGIKVLECHAFVCKKEMAANALVRCCFHAYADNTFVKQLETGNNIYGVVNNNHNNTNGGATEGGQLGAVNPIQKVEQWRAYVPSTSSSKDDLDGHLGDNSELVSIYDNNENHKVWSGGPNGNVNGQNGQTSGHQNDVDNERNSIYGDYISTTLRSSVKSTNGTLANGHKSNGRPRQLTTPSSPPPPPPPTQILAETETRTKGKKIPKKHPQSKHLGQNGNGVNGGGQLRWHPSSEFRPMWPSPPFMSPPPPLMQNGGMYPPPPPPHSAPMMPILMAPGHPPPPPPTSGGRMSRNGPQRQKNVMDEPIYVPVTGRAFKNGGSQLYHPGGFPYAAEDPNSYYLMGPAGPMGIPPPAPGTPIGGGSSSRTPTPTKYKKKKDKKSNSDSETKYSTGIYRKKGHLNERAFSYSIRQEHRSRSHSSLATLSFNADTNGHEQSEDERQQLKPIDNNHHHHHEHSYKNGGGVKMAANGHHSKMNGASPQQQKMPKHAATNGANGAKHDSGLSSDSSLGHGGHVARNGKMAAAPPTLPVKKGGGAKNGQRSELNIKDLNLSDDGQIRDEYPTLKAKNKQPKKMAANSKNLKMANNNNNTNNKKR